MQTTRRKIFFRSLCLIVVPVAAILSASVAQANTITQSLDFRLNSVTASATLNFNPFNAALGTLDSVDVSFDATRRHAWGIWNVSGTAGAVPYDVNLQDTTLTMDGNIFDFADLHYGPAVTPVLASTGFPDFLLQFLAGQSQFLAGLDPVFGPGAFQPATAHTAITNSFAASSFAGVLSLAYAYDPGVFSVNSNGAFAGSLVDVFGTATVTYGYTPHTVPDTSSVVGALAFTFCGLVVASKRLRVKTRAAGRERST